MFNPKSLSGILEKWGLDETEQKDMSNISKYGGLGLLKTFGYVILAIFGGGATIIGVFMSGLVFSFLSVIIGLVGIVLLVFGMRGFLNQMLKPLIVIFKERISKYKTIAEQSLKDVGGSIEMV
jgi:hypothetical protein